MAFQYHGHGRPQVIQGRFPGGRPTIIQPKPASSQPQVPAYVQEAIHRGAPAFYRHVAQRKQHHEARTQAGAARSDNTTLLPATFLFAPSIGQPLPPSVQAKMEAYFGADFSDVRVHVGPQAQQIGALAFTRGSDIYFAPGQYMPHHSHGQRLLGHELAHVVQQRAGRVRNPVGKGVAVVQDPALEAEADRMGLHAAAHRTGLHAAAHRVPVQAKRNEASNASDQRPHTAARTVAWNPTAPNAERSTIQCKIPSDHIDEFVNWFAKTWFVWMEINAPYLSNQFHQKLHNVINDNDDMGVAAREFTTWAESKEMNDWQDKNTPRKRPWDKWDYGGAPVNMAEFAAVSDIAGIWEIGEVFVDVIPDYNETLYPTKGKGLTMPLLTAVTGFTLG